MDQLGDLVLELARTRLAIARTSSSWPSPKSFSRYLFGSCVAWCVVRLRTCSRHKRLVLVVAPTVAPTLAFFFECCVGDLGADLRDVFGRMNLVFPYQSPESRRETPQPDLVVSVTVMFHGHIVTPPRAAASFCERTNVTASGHRLASTSCAHEPEHFNPDCFANLQTAYVPPWLSAIRIQDLHRYSRTRFSASRIHDQITDRGRTI